MSTRAAPTRWPGRKWTLVHAGARKTDGNPHEPLSDRALAAIQADVDALHAEFCALVARNRRLTPEAVRATEAAIWRGKAGIAAGFADRLGTLDQALADLAASLDPPPGRSARLLTTRPMQGTSMTEQTTDRDRRAARRHRSAREPTAPATPPETPPAAARAAPRPSLRLPQPAAAAPAAGAEAERLRAEYAEIAAVAAQAARLGSRSMPPTP